MYRFLLKIFFFAVAVLVCNALYLVIVIKTDFNFQKRLETLNFENPTYELLVLGNSLALDGIDTELLTENGYDSYNMALAGSSIFSIKLQLEEYLSSYQHKPEYIILGLGSYINYIDNDSKQIHPVVDFTRKEKSYTFDDIPMIRFKWIFIDLLKKLVSKKHREAYLKHGQLRFSKQVADKSKIDSSRTFPFKEYEFNRDNPNNFSDIINICSNKGIKLIIVEMPGFKKVRHKKSFDRLILDKSNNNAILFDYNNFEFAEIFDSQTDWIGNNHLNVYGAKKLTNRLVQDLNTIDAFE